MAVREQNRRKKILLGEDRNALTWLIILNGLFFVSVYFIEQMYAATGDNSLATKLSIEGWVALPAEGYRFLTHPWTLLTYMFAHNNFWYIISSVLWLWCFGYILQDLAGNNKLFPVYLYGGVAGGIVFLVTANLIPSMHANAATHSLMGAGASVMAVAIAATALAPGFRILPMLNGGIPLWVITSVFAAIDLGTLGRTNGAVAAAHIGGGLTGFLFILQLRRGNDMGAWIINLGNWINNLFNPEKKYKQEKLFYNAKRKPFEKTHNFSQQKLDEILDKINEHGYHHLTEEEKEFLKQASKENL